MNCKHNKIVLRCLDCGEILEESCPKCGEMQEAGLRYCEKERIRLNEKARKELYLVGKSDITYKKWDEFYNFFIVCAFVAPLILIALIMFCASYFPYKIITIPLAFLIALSLVWPFIFVSQKFEKLAQKAKNETELKFLEQNPTHMELLKDTYEWLKYGGCS